MLSTQDARGMRLVESVRELLGVLNSHRSLGEIFDCVLEQATALLDTRAAAIYLVGSDQGQQFLEARASRGLPADRVAIRLRVGSAVSGLAVARGRPVTFNDLNELVRVGLTDGTDIVTEDAGSHLIVRAMGVPSTDPESRVRLQRLARSHPAALAVPLLLRGEARGTLTLFYSRAHAFSDEDVQLASAFAEQAALAIENASLRDGAQQRAVELETLYRLDERMHASLQLHDVLQALVDTAAEILSADKTSVLLWDAERERLTVQAAHGFQPSTIPSMSYPRGEGISTRVATSGEPIVVEDVRFDPRITPRIREINEAEGIRSLISVPIKVNDQVVGVFNANCIQARTFSADEQRLLLAVGQRAATAITNARLYAEAGERLRELEALYQADQTLHSSLRLDDVLQALVDLATDVLGADKTSMLVWNKERTHLVPGATRGFAPENVAKMKHAPGDGITALVAVTGQLVVVSDATQDPRVAHRITGPEDIRSLMHVPISVSGQVFGVFGVNYCQPHQFTRGEQRLLQGLAQRAAVAIQNAQLYGEVQQRLHEIERRREIAEGLRDLLTILNSTSSLDAILDQVVAQASRLLGSAGSELYLPDASGALELRASYGIHADHGARLEVRLAVQAKTFGTLVLLYEEPREFTEEEVELASVFADQAALTIENARLSEQAQQAAMLEERQRLARELHDAVTQTLFSASLIAEVAPRLWDRDPAEGRRRLDELRGLTRGALAEMRALLLELRPGALVETPMPQLFRQLGDAARTRAGVSVDVGVDGDRELPPDVHVALYRVAQEALNNVVKHAGATHVDMHLRFAEDLVELTVADDGRGFDADSVAAGHLGLRIMHERAQAIGADLEVGAREGGGTRLKLVWRAATSVGA